MTRNSWWWRHPFIIFCLGVLAFGGGAIIGGIMQNGLVFAISISLGVLMMALSIYIEDKYDWLCPECGNKTYIRHRYCYKCGSMMYAVKVEPSRCPNGHPIERYMNFCEKCGVRLYEEVEE
jgi:hypothetical protein